MFRGTSVLGSRSSSTIFASGSAPIPAAAKRTAAPRTNLLVRTWFVAFFVVAAILPTFLTNISDNLLIEDIWWLMADVVAVAGLLKDRKQAFALLRNCWPLILILAFVCVSTFWSDDPGTSSRRALALLSSSLISFWLAGCLGLRATIGTLEVAVGILALTSVLLIVASPGIGIMPSGEWQGCFDRKNTLGQFMLIGIITTLCALPSSGGALRLARIGFLVLFLTLLVGARSGTSTFVVALVAVVLPTILWSRAALRARPKLLLVLGFTAALVVGLTATLGKGVVLDALGKDETLTTRTDVWDYVFDGIAERPLLGHGYKVFWLTHGGVGNDTGRNAITWATQAHNGFLEVALDLGWVGVAAVGLFLVSALRISFITFWGGCDWLAAWPFLIIVAFLVTNVAEATFLKYYDVEWVILAAAYVIAVRKRPGSPRVQKKPVTLQRPLGFLG